MPKLHVIELQKDQDVVAGIHAYLMDKNWKAGVIVAAVGSIYNVTLNNPITHEFPPKLLMTDVNEMCEVVSFMGEITRKEDAPEGLPCQIADTPSDYIVHIHMSCSYGAGNVRGGGFRKATVMRALNIYVLELE
ncbi:MAG: PPC domain-containing DNA-binding protein [Dysosmobacter sp.]|nr:PPC domain-containing DNA-binding protein [Dysosmobacter sp.]